MKEQSQITAENVREIRVKTPPVTESRKIVLGENLQSQGHITC